MTTTIKPPPQPQPAMIGLRPGRGGELEPVYDIGYKIGPDGELVLPPPPIGYRIPGQTR